MLSNNTANAEQRKNSDLFHSSKIHISDLILPYYNHTRKHAYILCFGVPHVDNQQIMVKKSFLCYQNSHGHSHSKHYIMFCRVVKERERRLRRDIFLNKIA